MTARLPALLRGERRALFARLIANGVAQAALAVCTVVLMPLALDATSALQRVLGLGGLALGAVALGLLRWLERVQAERLGQHYVHQLRRGLVASSLAGDGASLGITVARTTNDLTSVRNWVALGIAPLAVATPLITGSLVALAVVDPTLAVAVGVPLLAFAVSVAVLSRGLFDRTRQLRRRRGRLAAHLTDTVSAAPVIRASGGTRRELRGVDKRSDAVREAALARSRFSGAMRGAAATAAGLAVVCVTAVGAVEGLPIGTLAAALTVVGIMATPITDLARVVEYRQSFRAAAAILGPALVAGRAARTHDRTLARDARREGAAASGPGAGPDADCAGLVIRGLEVDGCAVPDLLARPGDRILAVSDDPDRLAATLAAVAGLGAHPGSPGSPGSVLVEGQDLEAAPDDVRRVLVGVAAGSWSLERGTVERAVRYRDPSCDVPVAQTLRLVGLDPVVAGLPKGARTRLKRGGEPLSHSERAQVLLARALHGGPPLLVLDHLDGQLGPAARRMMTTAVASHRGVVVAASHDPEVLGGGHRVWDLDAAHHPAEGLARC